METKLGSRQMEYVRRKCGFVHGVEVDSEDRNESWDVLKRLSTIGGIPWFICGDFNEIMYGSEKKRGLPRDERRMDLFRRTLEECQLIDIGYSSKWFTWEKGNLPETNIQERLDKGMANVGWLSLFSEGTSSENLMQKLENVKNSLGIWAAQIQASRKKRKQVLMAKLYDLYEAERDDNNLAELIDTKIYLNFEIEKDEKYWEQRARLNWLKFRDKNTAIFHSQATQHKKRNLIRKLTNEDGKEIEVFKEMKEVARSYFQKLFSAGQKGSYERLLSGIDRCITNEDNKQLTAKYTKEEIQAVVFELGPTKAPGEDGLPGIFYQKYWHIIGEEVMGFCLQLLNGDIKSAFVPGRLISDNVLLAYEILNMLKQKRMGKKGFMAVKIDMSKAYDRVEWDFIKQIMIRIGFATRWIEAIMQCVSTVSYSVPLYGHLGEKF
ncbi:hypothetical protein J1N35_001536 [Gossypium stocksii]|uniref:Reverse transcriptase n=1 Tax=Gossypium stocksii TaxID=47602 RepID=A0A9D4AM86_9ROSI|nr:hypothetical protein J1N35_001536 [Gossypium stocksii]